MQEPATLRPRFNPTLSDGSHPNFHTILARGVEPTETRRELPGEPDAQSRYIEAAVKGVLVGCLYVPNGNPAPGPKFDYKLQWYQRLIAMRPSRSQSTRRSCWRVKARADMVSTNARTWSAPLSVDSVMLRF